MSSRPLLSPTETTSRYLDEWYQYVVDGRSDEEMKAKREELVQAAAAQLAKRTAPEGRCVIL